MIICFDCSTATKAGLDKLLDLGHYRDYSEAIAAAVANQLLLHEAVAGSGAVVIGDGPNDLSVGIAGRDKRHRGDRGGSARHEATTTAAPAPRKRETRARDHRRADGEAAPSREVLPSAAVAPPTSIPDMFRLSSLSESQPSVAPLPSDLWAPGQVVPLDRWVFGQYNKMLPAKASCRALAFLLARQRQPIDVDEASQGIAAAAAELGRYLSLHDSRNGMARDDALSTAFPNTEGDGREEKSRSRYANQFVAGINRYGQLSGLLVDLKLINKTGRDGKILLTQPGWDFAMLPNPVLDGARSEPATKFDKEEIEFLLSHIHQSVPAEDFAYRAILQAIHEGVNTPEALDDYLKERYMPNTESRDLSPSFLSSQRSGAISRMADLELVVRVREGVRVSYRATEKGEQYASAHQGA